MTTTPDPSAADPGADDALVELAAEAIRTADPGHGVLTYSVQARAVIAALEPHIEALKAELEAVSASRERIAKAAMHGAGVVDVIPYWNGVKQVAAYTAFHDYWVTQLLSMDMQYMRLVMGIAEPSDAAQSTNPPSDSGKGGAR